MSRGPRIKVLHVITRLVRGGAQRVLIDLLRGLDRERFEVSLVAGEQTGREGSLWPEARGLGIETAALPALVREIAPLRDLRALRRLGRLLRERRPDIVHAHTSKAGLIGCAAARKAGVPGVVLAPHGHILGEDARIPGVPRRGLRRRVLALMARRSGRYADVVIAPNDSEREASIRLGLSTEEQAVTVPNGVDAERFRPGDRQGARALLGLSSADTVVGAVARLTVEKGIDLAVEAVAEL
ncbi:MAG: glycosyltransferase, partial [Planctomycetota bacterium]